MSLKDIKKLQAMHRKRFSHPLRHRFFERQYGSLYGQNGVDGYLRPSEGAMLYHWAANLAPNSNILEIGTFNGLSTCFLAAGAQRSNSFVYSIDPFTSDKGRQYREHDGTVDYNKNKKSKKEVEDLLNEKKIGNVQLIEGFSTEVAEKCNGPVDFLWIDGNHNQTRQDYEAWRVHLKDRSRVAFHDSHPKYGWQRVADYVEEVVEREVVEDLEQVKSITSFRIRAPKLKMLKLR